MIGLEMESDRCGVCDNEFWGICCSQGGAFFVGAQGLGVSI